MNYAPYDLQTHPVDGEKRTFETPLNPEEVPQVEYPSREEPGHFYAADAERKTDGVDATDEELVSAHEVQAGVEDAADETREMDFEDDGNLAANSGPGLRH